MSHKRPHEEYRDPDYPSAFPTVATALFAAANDTEETQTTPAKRIKIEERQSVEDPTKNACTAGSGSASAADRISDIVRREFASDLAEREHELKCIETRLLQAKRLLQRVRYAVVYNFYTNKRLVYTDKEHRNEQIVAISLANGCAEETIIGDGAATNAGRSTANAIQPTGDTGAILDGSNAAADVSQAAQLPQQTAIHPSLKKLLGTKDIDYNEILKVRPARQAAKDAKTSIREKLRTKKELRRLRMAAAPPLLQQDTTTPASMPTTVVGASTTTTIGPTTVPPKVPRYVSPIKSTKPNPFGQITTARGSMRNAHRHLLAVGNTSKYIGDDGDPATRTNDGVTHKWLVYVKCKAPTTRGIEEIVQKVRFFLHPSYKPNDVVEVGTAPFQIARRGWGEFPIRVQLFFHANVQQKPLQIFHQLVLDKKLTGLQTMGAETVVEMWLPLPPKEHKPAVRNLSVPVTPITSSISATTVEHDQPSTSAAAAAAADLLKAAPQKNTPTTPKKISPQQPASNHPTLPSLFGSPVSIKAEQDESATVNAEPCWDPDGLIKSVQISEAEQNSLLAMAEESKRFGLHTTLSPSTTASAALLLSMSPQLNGTANSRLNGSSSTFPTTPRRPTTAAMIATGVSNAARKIVIKSSTESTRLPSSVSDEKATDTKPANISTFSKVTISTAPNVTKVVPSATTVIASSAIGIRLNNTSVTNTISTITQSRGPQTNAAPAAATASGPVRKFVKCLNTAGKVVMVEVQTDPNNPKNIRIVRNNNNSHNNNNHAVVIASSKPSISSLPSTSTVSLPAGSISSNTTTTETTSNTLRSIAIGAAPVSGSPRIFVLPKATIAQTRSAPPGHPIQLQPPVATVKPVPTAVDPVAIPTSLNANATPLNHPIAAAAAGTKKVLLKNGQMFIIDTSKFVSRPIPQMSTASSSTAAAAMSSTQATSATTTTLSTVARPKQQSLLKPQISLLKSKLSKTAVPPQPAIVRTTTTQPSQLPSTNRSPAPASSYITNNTTSAFKVATPLKFAIKVPMPGSSNVSPPSSSSAASQLRPGVMLPFVRKGGTLVRVPMAASATTTASAAAAASSSYILARNPNTKVMLQRLPHKLPPPAQSSAQSRFRVPMSPAFRAPFPHIVLPPEKSLFNSAAAAAATAAQQRRLLAAAGAATPNTAAAASAAAGALVRQRIEYGVDLEQRFLSRSPFQTQRAAVEFLLRNVPMVHRLAGTNVEFAHAFPFVVDSEGTFEAYTWPKQRCVEWLRAKCVARLLAKASVAQKNALASTSASGAAVAASTAPPSTHRVVWTTKEIVLFARRFGYSLALRSPKASGTANNYPETAESASDLSKLIRREIKRSECEPDATITGSKQLLAWMNAWHARRSRRKRVPAAYVDEEFIDVMTDGETTAVPEVGRRKKRPGRADECVTIGKRRPRGLYPLPAAVRMESGWLADVCGQVHVKLQPEEIVDDILHPSSQLVLVTALHRFMSDLLHRAYASKPEADRNSLNAEDRVVRVEDVRKSIVSAAHFDFLTNRHLGSGGDSSSKTDTTIKKEGTH